MKKINLIIYTVVLSLIVVSCGVDIEDVNQNPNDPEVVPTNTIFNNATAQYTSGSRSAFNNGRLVLNWVEYWAQNAYADEDRYLYRESSAESLYQLVYLVGIDLKQILDINSNPETSETASAVGDNNNQIAASRIMLAYMFHQSVNTFGDIPYFSYGTTDPDFQALQVDEFLSPVFAPQEKIYADLLKELRESADMINTAAPVFTSGDNIFNGDATKWKKFANSLILRVAANYSSFDASAATAAINTAIADGVMSSNADNAAQAYEQADATSSPLWSSFIGRTDFALAAPFVDLLKGSTGNYGEDPRLFEMAAPISASIEQVKANSYPRSEDFNDYVGIPFAFQQANLLGFTLYSFPSSNVLKPDFSEMLMEYSEVEFLISEYNGFAQANYEAGVRASMEKWGVDVNAINTFISLLPPANEENVLNQKYVALYMQAHQAWAEQRRTGFPNSDILFLPGETYTLTPDQEAASGISTYTFIPGNPGSTELPNRLRYPVILQTLNGTNRSDAVSDLNNGDTIFSNLIWD